MADVFGIPRFTAKGYAGFPEQRAFATSTATRKSACCSRRAGKSKIVAADLLAGAIVPPFTNQFYITNTLNVAKKIIWPGLKALNTEHGLGGVPSESEFYIEFPNLGPDVHIYLAGAKDAGAIEKLRGTPAKKYCIDEPQSMPERILKPLMKDVVGPALMDYGGGLVLTGTPGPAPVGTFYELCESEKFSRSWDRHKWTWRDNVKLPRRMAGATIEEIEEEILREHGWTRDDPTWLREYCGLWVADRNALVFRFDPAVNVYAELPDGQWQYVVGVDLGHDDADAIVVLGWTERSRTVYLVEEHVKAKQGITELGDRLRSVVDRYRPRATWIDTGGLGKKIAVELRNRWNLVVEPAEKSRKLEHIEIVNDALRTGCLMVPEGSQFAEDAALLQWDSDELAKGARVEADTFHSDVGDAVLYAYRACRGYLYEAPIEVGERTAEQEAAELESERLERVARAEARSYWERDPEDLFWTG